MRRFNNMARQLKDASTSNCRCRFYRESEWMSVWKCILCDCLRSTFIWNAIIWRHIFYLDISSFCSLIVVYSHTFKNRSACIALSKISFLQKLNESATKQRTQQWTACLYFSFFDILWKNWANRTNNYILCNNKKAMLVSSQHYASLLIAIYYFPQRTMPHQNKPKKEGAANIIYQLAWTSFIKEHYLVVPFISLFIFIEQCSERWQPTLQKCSVTTQA